MGCFEPMFIFQVWRWQSPILGTPKRSNICFAWPLKENLDRQKRQQIIVPIGMDKTSKWSKSIVLVPKANDKARLCLDQARLNEVLFTPAYGGLMLNYILPRLAGMKYIMLTDLSSGYYNLKLDDKSPYLTTFSCPFGRYQYLKTIILSSPSGRYVQEENT